LKNRMRLAKAKSCGEQCGSKEPEGWDFVINLQENGCRVDQGRRNRVQQYTKS
jgi:hypothetical protein